MSEFELSTSRALVAIAELTGRISELASQTDNYQKQLNELAPGAVKMSKEITRQFQQLSASLKPASDNIESLDRHLANAERTVRSSMASIATSSAQATARIAAMRGEFGDLNRVMSQTSRDNAAANSLIKIANASDTLSNKSRELKTQRDLLNTSEGKLVLNRTAQVAGYSRLLTAETRQLMLSKQLTQAEALQSSTIGTGNAVKQARIAALRAEQQETTKQSAELARLERQMKSLDGGIAESIVRQRELVNERTRAIQAEVRGAQAARDSTASKKQETAQVSVLTREQRALNTERERALNTLARLRAQSQMLNTSYGRERVALDTQIAQQKSYNRLLMMSNAELLGFTAAKKRMTGNFNAANQSGAILRATMAGLQTSIGMYTSSTILAATATYGIARAIRSSIEVGSEYEYTMSRVQAIMSGGLSASESVTAMGQMDEYIRSLAQTTRFTASEVAKGMEELGMAGLSATEAMVALQPALDLAVIGNLDMAAASDIATNIMQTFGLQAQELTHVVDVMSTAITNSNTTVQQLANALSYVGPAAETAGFSLEDTVAAIEVLSNTGVKASRAGTGLRRMMVNLLNPTTKGAAMLERFGIMVDDAAGGTREFSDILGQLNSALFNDAIDPAERLAAIVDLVGVRASSAAAALIGQSGDGGWFGTMRQQLEDAAGAGERMRKIIQDNLSSDWLNVKSGFQEVQLAAMESQVDRLRLLSIQVTKYFSDLTATENADGTRKVITDLDMLLARVERTAQSIAYATAGFVAFKVATGSWSNSLSDMFGKFGTHLGVVSDRMLYVQGVQQGTISSAMKFTAANKALNKELGTATFLASGLATGMSRAAAAAAMFTRALGWIGLVGGIGYALYNLFSGDIVEDIKEQKDAVKDLQAEYERLRKGIEDTALARQRGAMEGRLVQLGVNIEGFEKDLAKVEDLIADVSAEGPSPYLQALQSESNALVNSLQSTREEQESINAALGIHASTSADVLKTRGNLLASLAKEKELRDLIYGARDEEGNRAGGLEAEVRLTSVQGGVNTRLMKELSQAHRDYAAVQENTIALSQAHVETATKEVSTLAELSDTWAEFLNKDVAAWMLEGGTASEKAAKAQIDYNEALTDYETQLEALREAEATGNMNLASRGDALRAQEVLQVAALENLKAQAALSKERIADEQSLVDVKEQMLRYEMSQEELLVHLENKLKDVNDELALRASLSEFGSDLATAGLRTEAEILEDILKFRQQIDGIRNRRAPRDTSGDELKRSIEQAQSAYNTLEDAMNPVLGSYRELSKQVEQMDLLLEHSKISTDAYSEALRHLRMEHYEVVRAQDEHRDSLQNLRDSYYVSPFETSITDLTKLNVLLAEGRVEMDEYIRMRELMSANSAEGVVSGAPTVNFRMGGANASPLNDLMSTTMEHGQNLGWYEQQNEDLYAGFERQRELITLQAEQKKALQDEYRNQELITEEEHARQLLAIEANKGAALTATYQEFGDQKGALIQSQAAYEEQMSRMVMMSMMNTAQNILGMFAATGEEATNAQKLAFVAQQTIGVASILLNAHIAQASMMAAVPGPAGIALGAKVLAMGYASAGLAAGLAIGQLAGGGSSGGGSYSGAYDKGGWIPADSWGVVGEYGPEIVHGPANVTGRERSAKKLGGSEGPTVFAPEINVTVEHSGGGSGSSGEEEGRALGMLISNAVLAGMRNEMRPNGMLDNWRKGGGRG